MMCTLAMAVTPIAPGEKDKIPGVSFLNSDNEPVPTNLVDFDEENFVVSTKKITKGASLIESISFNDDDQLVIKFKQDYEMALDTKTDVVISELAVKAKKSVENDDTSVEKYAVRKNEEFKLPGKLEYNVGYTKVEKDLVEDDDVDLFVGIDTNNLIAFDKANTDGAAYATVTVDYDGEAYAEGRVYDGDEVFYGFDMDADTDILKAYPDAELRFYNFNTNGYPTTMSFELYAAEDEYVYAVKDGKLTNSGLKWDEDTYAWTGKVRSSVSYVVSDIELDTAATVDGETTTDTTENPETGANDVVGVATALAVVSLVAAGAVSLKK